MPAEGSVLAQAHILHCEGADPAADRFVKENSRVRMIIVFVPEPAAAPAVAADLVDNEGVQLIELDGGLGPLWAARVIDAVDGRVPVGAVMFGAESLAGAAAFGAKYSSARLTGCSTTASQRDTDPDAPRRVHTSAPHHVGEAPAP